MRPEGTAEGGEYSQSSLRDEGLCSDLPGVETPGYCRMSLRDKTPAACARRFLIAPRQQNRREALADAQAAGRLAYRHAGRFDSRALSRLDARPEAREGDQFNYRLTGKGVVDKRSLDAMDTAQFEALLDAVKEQLRQMGRQIYAGRAEAAPYRKGAATACDQCAYRSICRIDPWTHPFRVLRNS